MYGNENYRKVKEEIEARRMRAIAEADARALELSIQNEEIRNIDRELKKTGLTLFRAACKGEDITPIREKNLSLTEKREKVLLSLGLPTDYTEPKYTCPICSDTGYVGESMCPCMKQMLITENIKSSGMGKLIEKQSFDNFSLEYFEYDSSVYKRMKDNLEAAKKYAETVGTKENDNLLLIGYTGLGKTHIASAIARRAIERGLEVIYDSSQNIVAAFEYDRFKSKYSQEESRSEKYLECDLLILDDLGTEYVNEITLSCLYNLLATRYNNGLPTVMSTNHSPKNLREKYEERICSRIFGEDTRILQFLGMDRRIKGL